MKITSYIILTFFLLIQSARADYKEYSAGGYSSKEYYQYTQSDYIAINNSDIITKTPQSSIDFELENPLRRFEITFFISLPFVFAISFVTLHIFGVIKDSIEKNEYDGNVNVWKDHNHLLLSSTFALSTGMAFREAWNCSEENERMRTRSSIDKKLFFYVSKNY